MDEYVGKICPYCKTEIKEGDEVKVCPECGIPHHAACWEENKGCTTFGCKEQHYEEQHTNPTDVCSNCGAPLGDGQAFCPKCGTPKNAPKKNVCGKCGTELQEGQEFCPKCGQKVGLAVDAGVNAAINQFNSGVQKTNSKKKTLPLIIGAAVVAIVVLAVALGGGGKSDFNKMFSEYADESWCYIADDGSYMKVDTNPYDIDDYTDFDAYHAIEDINSKLGFSSALFSKIGETSAMDGRQSDSNDKYSVSWKYHPDNGMEVTYEVKK